MPLLLPLTEQTAAIWASVRATAVFSRSEQAVKVCFSKAYKRERATKIEEGSERQHTAGGEEEGLHSEQREGRPKSDRK